MNFYPAMDVMSLFLLIAAAIIGLCLGSFATAMIHRLPHGIPLGQRARSACTVCDKKLAYYDLVPVFSFILSRGKCRYCGSPVSLMYPLVEISTALLVVGFLLVYGVHAVTFILILMAPVMLAILVIDLKHMIIPDVLNLVLALGAFFAVLIHSLLLPAAAPLWALWTSVVAGGVLYFALAYVLAMFFEKILDKEALGGGDIKFFGAAGLWLGVGALPYFMMLAGSLGILFALADQWYNKRKTALFPFGPALIAAFITLLFWQKTVIF